MAKAAKPRTRPSLGAKSSPFYGSSSDALLEALGLFPQLRAPSPTPGRVSGNGQKTTTTTIIRLHPLPLPAHLHPVDTCHSASGETSPLPYSRFKSGRRSPGAQASEPARSQTRMTRLTSPHCSSRPLAPPFATLSPPQPPLGLSMGSQRTGWWGGSAPARLANLLLGGDSYTRCARLAAATGSTPEKGDSSGVIAMGR